MGSARIYVALILGIILFLAGVGVSHIISAWNSRPFTHNETAAVIQPESAVERDKAVAVPKTATPTTRSNDTIASSSVEPQMQSPGPAVSPAHATPSNLEREVAITDVKQTKKRGRRGETLVVATIGIASRANVEKSGLEIHISFFDLTARNEIRPTTAQVTYRWLTPVRDWSDPAPKYLAATYLQWPTRYRSFARDRYGGFLIQIKANGKLQDERSEPAELLTRLRGGDRPKLGSEGAPDASPDRSAFAGSEKSVPLERSSESPSASPLSGGKVSRDSSLPYGKPVPGKPGFVSSPFDSKFIIDVRGFPPGTLVNDPNTNKPFRVP